MPSPSAPPGNASSAPFSRGGGWRQCCLFSWLTCLLGLGLCLWGHVTLSWQLPRPPRTIIPPRGIRGEAREAPEPLTQESTSSGHMIPLSGPPRSSPQGLSPPPQSSVISSGLGQGVQGCETAKAHVVHTDADQDVGALQEIQAWKTPRATWPNFFILQVGKWRFRNTHRQCRG